MPETYNGFAVGDRLLSTGNIDPRFCWLVTEVTPEGIYVLAKFRDGFQYGDSPTFHHNTDWAYLMGTDEPTKGNPRIKRDHFKRRRAGTIV